MSSGLIGCRGVPGDDPSIQLPDLQHPDQLFVDRETGAGVEAGEMQSTLADARAGQPPVDHRVQLREPCRVERPARAGSLAVDLPRFQACSINLGSELDAEFELDGTRISPCCTTVAARCAFGRFVFSDPVIAINDSRLWISTPRITTRLPMAASAIGKPWAGFMPSMGPAPCSATLLFFERPID